MNKKDIIRLKGVIKTNLKALDVDKIKDPTLLTQLFDVLYKIQHPVPHLTDKQVDEMIDNHIEGIQQ